LAGNTVHETWWAGEKRGNTGIALSWGTIGAVSSTIWTSIWGCDEILVAKAIPITSYICWAKSVVGSTSWTCGARSTGQAIRHAIWTGVGCCDEILIAEAI